MKLSFSTKFFSGKKFFVVLYVAASIIAWVSPPKDPNEFQLVANWFARFYLPLLAVCEFSTWWRARRNELKSREPVPARNEVESRACPGPGGRDAENH